MPMHEHSRLCVPEATEKRITKYLCLADAIVEMIALAPPAGARQAGVSLCRSMVAHSLDFDAGVLPCSTLLPHTHAIDEAVIAIVAATMDLLPRNLSDDQRQQLALPTRFAGVQLDLPSRLAPLARAARVIECGPAVRGSQDHGGGGPAGAHAHALANGRRPASTSHP